MLSLPMASEFIFVFSQVCIDMLPAHAQMMLSLGRSVPGVSFQSLRKSYLMVATGSGSDSPA